mmetsp:Transcript_99612/g.237492  ORF Transcript_99612/g.237492 Transcript_99612/m.237492 type:complete len:215 (+) Transcript_99612:685-1329(+)
MSVLIRRLHGDGLSVVHLGLARSQGLHLELAAHALAVDLQMQLPHARDDGFIRLLLHLHAEGRVFALKTPQCLLETRLIISGSRHRQRHHWLGDEHGAARQSGLAIREGHARLTVHPGQRYNVARQGLRHIFNLVGVHAHQSLHRDPLVVHHVDDIVALAYLALIDPHVGHLPGQGMVLDLEGIAHQWVLSIRGKLHYLILVVCLQSDVLPVQR